MFSILIGLLGYGLGTLFFMASVVTLHNAADIRDDEQKRFAKKSGFNCSVIALALFYVTGLAIKLMP